MQKPEFERLLQLIRRARTKPEAVCAWDMLRRMQNEPWLDAALLEQLRQTCRAKSLPPPVLSLRPLAVGEAWLLLYEARSSQGRVSRLRVSPKPEPLEDSGILHELERAQTGLNAALARSGRLLPVGLGTRSFRVEQLGIEGDSLGVSACVALMSLALGRPPAEEVAASAQVRPDGSLAGVSHLKEKVSALALARPEVRRVIVAEDQRDIDHCTDLALIRVGDIERALRLFALDPAELSRIDEHALIAELNGYKSEEERDLGTETWRERSLRARALASLFQTHLEDERHAAESVRLSALFALHGGNPELAEDLLAAAPVDGLDAELGAWKTILEAAARIDVCPEDAPARAKEALDLCNRVEGERTRVELYARALGTYGRALTHAGRPEDAEAPLRESLALHERAKPPRERSLDGKSARGALHLPAHPPGHARRDRGHDGLGQDRLVTVMVEEALRAKVPVLMVDVKGDLPNLVLSSYTR